MQDNSGACFGFFGFFFWDFLIFLFSDFNFSAFPVFLCLPDKEEKWRANRSYFSPCPCIWMLA